LIIAIHINLACSFIVIPVIVMLAKAALSFFYFDIHHSVFDVLFSFLITTVYLLTFITTAQTDRDFA